MFFPPVPNRDDLRRREEEHVAGSRTYELGSAEGYPLESVHLPTQSDGFQTQSVIYPTQSAASPYINSAAPVLDYSVPQVFTLIPNTSPSPIPTLPVLNLAPGATGVEPRPQLFTGAGFELNTAVMFPVIVTFVAFWYALQF